MAYEKKVDLVLTGQLMPGYVVEQVKLGLAAAFKRSAHEVEQLFAATPYVIKKDLPESQLPSYLKLFAAIGAIVRVDPASSAVALIGAEAFAAQAAPPPAEPVRSEALSVTALESAAASTTGASIAEAAQQLSCPKCGHLQPRRTLCLQCGTDMPRFLQAQREAQEEPAQEATPYAAPQAVVYSASARGLPAVIALSVDGRIGRLRSMAWGIPAILALMIAALILIMGAMSGHVVNMLFGVCALILGCIVLVRVSVLRLHDFGRTGWWVLLYIVPVLNFLLHIALMLVPGDENENEYGPVPEPNTPWVIAGASVIGIIYFFDVVQLLHRHRA